MMAKKPLERFQAAHELVEVLGDWLQEFKRPVSSSLAVEDQSLDASKATPKSAPTSPATSSPSETELGLAPLPEEMAEDETPGAVEQISPASDELELGLAP